MLVPRVWEKPDLLYRFVESRFVEPAEEPVIVLGNQKSGTSVVAHLLADAAGLSKTIDAPPFWRNRFRLLYYGDRTVEELVDAYSVYFDVDLVKEPMLTFAYDQVRERFPDADYVQVVRDPRDNIRSLLDRHDLPGDAERLPDSHRERLEAKKKTTIDADLWAEPGDHYIDVLAKRWNMAVDPIFEADQSPTVVRYEDFVEDKVGTIHDLADSLDLEIVEDISEKVDRSFQPRGQRRGRSYPEVFGEENLDRIERICGDRMVELGYEPQRETPRLA